MFIYLPSLGRTPQEILKEIDATFLDRPRLLREALAVQSTGGDSIGKSDQPNKGAEIEDTNSGLGVHPVVHHQVLKRPRSDPNHYQPNSKERLPIRQAERVERDAVRIVNEDSKSESFPGGVGKVCKSIR